MATPDNTPSPPPGPLPGQQPPKGSEPRPRRVRTPREFNAQLVNLRTGKGLTLEELNKRSQGRLPKSTVSNNLNKNTLPTRDFVERYVRACKVGDQETNRWLQLWESLNDPAASQRWRWSASAFTVTLPRLGGSSRRGSLLAVAVSAVVIGSVVWWRGFSVPAAPPTATEHCHTANPNLIAVANGECVGVTDGTDNAGVFGPDLQPVITKIAAENKRVVADGKYVTIAFVAPLTSVPGGEDDTGGRAIHELEGAFTAQKTANASSDTLKIRLILANEGHDEKHWKSTVEALKKMTGGPHHLVAVAGLGLSQQESVDAARALAAEPAIPMVADVITADGFDATGRIDGKKDSENKIRGLARVAPNVSDQVKAISKELKTRRDLHSAALVRADVTFTGSKDLYAASLQAAFQKNPDLKPYLDRGGLDFPFDPGVGNRAAMMNNIAKGLCGKVIPDMIFYAGRAAYLPDFMKLLRQRPCHREKITVITGSDAAKFEKNEFASEPESPIEVIYVPLADPEQLADSRNNPDHGLYTAFEDAFTKEGFLAAHLNTGWAIMAHDAVLTLTTVIRNAASNPLTRKEVIPNTRDVGAGLRNLDAPGSSNVIPGASGTFTIHPENGNRISTQELKTVHRP